ncbi:hypothetical protein BSL78_10215 [Apostichopus japonicus]|uniref:Apple domain-containing protein n=1 Tax=Stichopus japonicus TaxID=307972 RepID=A0A2G8KY26_STIJA|nr:hypothetical protein BSL78_10215 [Apostichopus japonicus]
MATYNVTETITDVTESTCAEACLYSAEFKCLSFDFNFVDSICFLSTGNSSSMDGILEVNKDVNHFERLQGMAWSHFVIYLASSRWERSGKGCGGRRERRWRKKGSCSNPAVGLEEGVISLDQISMSSYLGGNEDGPLGISKDHVRLNSEGGWCAKEQDDIDDITEWIQVSM